MTKVMTELSEFLDPTLVESGDMFTAELEVTGFCGQGDLGFVVSRDETRDNFRTFCVCPREDIARIVSKIPQMMRALEAAHRELLKLREVGNYVYPWTLDELEELVKLKKDLPEQRW